MSDEHDAANISGSVRRFDRIASSAIRGSNARRQFFCYMARKRERPNAERAAITGELLEKMGLKGDKAGEMSVSDALIALTKNNQLMRRDGKYHAATACRSARRVLDRARPQKRLPCARRNK